MTYGIVCVILKPQRENQNTNGGRDKLRQNKITYKLVCANGGKTMYKWYVTISSGCGEKKTLTVKASSKQDAIKKAALKTGWNTLIDCKLIRT